MTNDTMSGKRLPRGGRALLVAESGYEGVSAVHRRAWFARENGRFAGKAVDGRGDSYAGHGVNFGLDAAGIDSVVKRVDAREMSIYFCLRLCRGGCFTPAVDKVVSRPGRLDDGSAKLEVGMVSSGSAARRNGEVVVVESVGRC